MKSTTLIIQPQQGIGDYMWFIRHVHAIAESTREKKVVLLTRPRSQADILSRYDAYIEKVLWLDIRKGSHDRIRGVYELARLLKPYKFDSAWILHSRSLRYGVACKMAGIKNIHGPGVGLQKYFLTTKDKRLKAEDQKTHPIKRATKLLENHGLKFLTYDKAVLPLPPIIILEMKKRLKDYPRPWIGFVIGSSEAEKKWPVESYVQLGKKLSKKVKGSIFILGGTAEKEEGKSMEKEIKKTTPHCLFFSEDLWRGMFILSQCEFVIGNDTGLTHAVPMVGGKGIVLLGHAQVPIHQYVFLEGVHIKHPEKIQELSFNNMQDISINKVMEKLVQLGWI